MLAGVGPFAIERGLVRASDPATRVSIYMVNTGNLALATVPTPGGEVRYDGTTAIAGHRTTYLAPFRHINELKPGDVILKIDGRAVNDAESLRYRIATKALNGTADLAVYRRGQQLDLTIALTAPPETVPRETTRLEGKSPLTGATVTNLSPAVADELGVSAFEKGVVVAKVAPDTPAGNLGVKPGDVILRINGADTRNVDELRAALARQSGTWQLSLRRGERVLNVVVTN